MTRTPSIRLTPSAALTRAVFCCIVALFATSTQTLADGKFFRAETVARDPSIPHQAALIAHRDGAQTMIVQSAIDAEGDAVGWILPLPAEPTAIEPVTAGVLKTLDALIQPNIIEARSILLFLCLAAGCMLGSFVTFASARYIRQIRRPAFRLIRIGVIFCLASLLFTVVFALFAAPGLSLARSAATAGDVDISMEVQVGAYDVTVLTADRAEHVCAWLEDNGFHCEPAAVPVIERHINEGWRFAAAQIRREDDRLLEPHPLQVTFPAASPIYPMRLTGVGATEPLDLDLYVISEHGAAADGLDLWRRDVLLRDADAVDEHGAPARVYEAEATRLAIGHPQITPLLWDGCTLTHLRGTLTPQRMARDDVHLSSMAGDDFRRSFYTRDARYNLVVVAVFSVLAVAFLIATVCAAQPTVRVQRAVGWSAGVGVGLGVAAVSFVYMFIPVTATEAARTSLYHRLRDGFIVRLVDDAHAAADPEANRDLIVDLRDGAFDERPAADVPHGVVIDELDDTWRITVYDHRAVPTTWQLAMPVD